jgi:hypothetical protein
MLCAALLLYNKLSSLRPSGMFAWSVTHVRGTRSSPIRRDPEYAFTPLLIFLSPSLKVIAVCEHHGVKDVMELKYDWNDEVIL